MLYITHGIMSICFAHKEKNMPGHAHVSVCAHALAYMGSIPYLAAIRMERYWSLVMVQTCV